MTVILHSPPQLPSHSSSSSITTTTCISPSSTNDVSPQQTNFLNNDIIPNPVALYRRQLGDQLSVFEAFTTIFRKSFVGCKTVTGIKEQKLMEIGWPTNVRHVAHVTFDRFNGFLGLPVEFEPEVPRRPPSASTRVFGVSTESMQLSFDSRGNCVPTILLMMQRRLYLQGGLQSEGIFRINAENGQEEYVREQLNNGQIPENIDVHCLAGLIKAWFRELPKGVLDPLSPEHVMQAQSEEDCTHLVRLLPPTESALLDWAINLMADVAQFEHLNKMNARNIAMVFAPNMTQMSDPLTALMYAVQVMNFLKTLISKTLREREDNIEETGPPPQPEPSNEDGHHSSILKLINLEAHNASEEEEANAAKEAQPNEAGTKTEEKRNSFVSFMESMLPNAQDDQAAIPRGTVKDILESSGNCKPKNRRKKRGMRKHAAKENANAEKSKDSSVLRRVNSETERPTEAWR